MYTGSSVVDPSIRDCIEILELGLDGGDDGISACECAGGGEATVVATTCILVGVIGFGSDDLKLATLVSKLFIWSSIP